MSIELEMNNNNNSTTTSTSNNNNNNYNHDLHHIGRSGFAHDTMTCFPNYNVDNSVAEEFGGGGGDDRPLLNVEAENPVDDSCSSTSSIGKNSDEFSVEEKSLDGGEAEEEVRSKYKGGGDLDNLQELEEVLPIKRSISNFYAGKSKSYTSLEEAVTCSSIKEIVKPENAYSRKRKNLLAYSNFWDKNDRGSSIRRNSSSSGVSKRPLNTRSTLGLAAIMGPADSPISNSSSPGIRLPPLPPQVRRSTPIEDSSSSSSEQVFSPWRSLSLSDLQDAAAAASPSISGITENHRQD